MIEEDIILLKNPFNTATLVTKVVDESGRSHLQMIDLLKNNVIEQENEWYVLFENGTLVKKGRSKVSTSSYVNKTSNHISINSFYGNV